jgi:hypothetical protein
LYGNNESLIVVGGLFDLINRKKQVIVYLQRSDNNSYDLIIHHGISNPINFKDCKLIRDRIKKVRPSETVQVYIRDEEVKERLKDDWKLNELYSIKSNGRQILMRCSLFGLRFAALVCKELAENSDQGHTHFDYWSTKDSLELIIRNKDTDI